MGLASEKTYTQTRFPAGFKPSEPARSREQAFELARSYPDDMPSVVVKTGKKGSVFPYTIYVREMYGNKMATTNYRKILDR